MRKAAQLLISSAWLLSCGCGVAENRAEVSGEVLVAGEPLASGSISFRPTEGNEGPTAGARITDGKYQVAREKGVSTGKNLVQIRGMKKTGRKVARYGHSEDEMIQFLPPRYNVHSSIVRDVQPGSNVFDFDLEVE
jgi:hypothetical protein